MRRQVRQMRSAGVGSLVEQLALPAYQRPGSSGLFSFDPDRGGARRRAGVFHQEVR
jgi:hypothetical protein